jgi:asparagine synthase (glutamine-hydrolysing)
MCGIVGLLGRSGAAPDPTALGAMVATLQHRGPDASGTWTSGPVALGHTRLSLVDPRPTADQPWVDGDDALVFNGELYNHRDLARELTAAGVRLATTCDTEVLFHALRRWGVAPTFARIRGMFAFAFHDGRTATTHLCRDRFGIKPLLYAERSGRVELASEVKALLAIAPRPIDPVQALFSIRTLGDKYLARTAFRGIRQVPPGGHVTITDGSVRSVAILASPADLVDPARYHELDRSPFGAVVDELGDVLGRAVSTMSVADAPLGAFVSGGVDSGLLAALAHGEREDFRGFTADVTGPHSELAEARALAGHVGFDLGVAQFRPDDWLDRWASTTWSLETPVITNPSALPFGAVAERARSDGYKAVLTGEGADELFLGYPRLASAGIERLARAPLAAVQALYRRSPRLADALLDERDAASSAFVRKLAGAFEEDAVTEAALDRYAFAGPRPAVLMAESLRMLSTSLQALLQRNDRLGMAASIESRFPFLDEDVVAFAVNLPVRHKLRRVARVHDPKHPFVQDKAVVRELASRVVGAGPAGRPKRGFPTPGLRAVRMRPGAFAGSWVAETFEADASVTREIDAWEHGYDAAKLASVEIFGRLFDAGQSVDEVDRWVRQNVDLQG